MCRSNSGGYAAGIPISTPETIGGTTRSRVICAPIARAISTATPTADSDSRLPSSGSPREGAAGGPGGAGARHDDKVRVQLGCGQHYLERGVTGPHLVGDEAVLQRCGDVRQVRAEVAHPLISQHMSVRLTHGFQLLRQNLPDGE